MGKINRHVDLLLWEGDYGTPSVDPNSLAVYTYMKITNINFQVRYPRNPLLYTIPSVVSNMNYERRFSCEKEGIIDFYSLDKHLKFNEMTDTESWVYRTMAFQNEDSIQLVPEDKLYYRVYIEYLKRNLLPGIWYTMWGDEQNYLEVTGKWYRTNLWFPLNTFYPFIKRKMIIHHLQSLVPNGDLETYSYLLINRAKECLDTISLKLFDESFFSCNDSLPSILDVVVYSYLSPLLTAPLLFNQLQSYLKEQENLVKFVKRINNKYFPKMKVEYKYVTKLQEEDHEFRSSPGVIFGAVFCAATAMIGYGIIVGIIQMS